MPRWTFVGTTRALTQELKTWPLTLPLWVYLEITHHAESSPHLPPPHESSVQRT